MSLLIKEEKPLLLIPRLAVYIGLNEAIVLQQLDYMIDCFGKNIGNRKWIRVCYDDLKDVFPFFSVRTIQRAVLNLENRNFILGRNHNKNKTDKTKWYSINYDDVSVICPYFVKRKENKPSFKKKEVNEIYKNYIRSKEWQSKREEAFSYYGKVCNRCGTIKGSLHVHHKTYKNFTKEHMEDLEILCEECHSMEHK